MKVIVLFLTLASFFGCQDNLIDDQKDGEFTSWSESLTLVDVRTMFNAGTSFMSDARTLSSISPFSFKDSVLSVGAIDASINYPYTTSEGLTSVAYKDSLIFNNSWNGYYMDGVTSMTTVEYGEYNGFKLLRITNESRFPPNSNWPNGYYARENRLFVESNGDIKEVDLKGYYALGEIEVSSRDGVIILFFYDFIRSNPKYQYLMLLDLSSRKNKVFKFDY